MLIQLSIHYFNPLVLYTIKPAGVNIMVCSVTLIVAYLAFSLSVKKKGLPNEANIVYDHFYGISA